MKKLENLTFGFGNPLDPKGDALIVIVPEGGLRSGALHNHIVSKSQDLLDQINERTQRLLPGEAFLSSVSHFGGLNITDVLIMHEDPRMKPEDTLIKALEEVVEWGHTSIVLPALHIGDYRTDFEGELAENDYVCAVGQALSVFLYDKEREISITVMTDQKALSGFEEAVLGLIAYYAPESTTS